MNTKAPLHYILEDQGQKKLNVSIIIPIGCYLGCTFGTPNAKLAADIRDLKKIHNSINTHPNFTKLH